MITKGQWGVFIRDLIKVRQSYQVRFVRDNVEYTFHIDTYDNYNIVLADNEATAIDHTTFGDMSMQMIRSHFIVHKPMTMNDMRYQTR
jgi:hypothetical protein